MQLGEKLVHRVSYFVLFLRQTIVSWLWKSLPAKTAQSKSRVNDTLFDPQDRMERVSEMWLNRAGREPTIMSVFWLSQKATLFEETPLLTPENKINPDALVAAERIYGVLKKMQSVPYGDLPCPDEACWLFLQIERGMRDKEQVDEQFYILSDAVKKRPAGLKFKSEQISLEDAIEAAKSAVGDSAESESPSKGAKKRGFVSICFV